MSALFRTGHRPARSPRRLRVYAIEGPAATWKSVFDLAPGARVVDTAGPPSAYVLELEDTRWAEAHPRAFRDIVELAEDSTPASPPPARARREKPKAGYLVVTTPAGSVFGPLGRA